MTSPRKILLSFALMLALSPAVSAQVQAQGQAQKDKDNPIYRITINVVQRSTVAINYRQHSSFTTIDFRGTPRRHIKSHKRYATEQERDARHHSWIRRAYRKNHARHDFAECQNT